jgi:hypothetical protein
VCRVASTTKCIFPLRSDIILSPPPLLCFLETTATPATA